MQGMDMPKPSYHDEVSRLIGGPTLPIGASSAFSGWLEPM
jgi:hypothetical protein